MICRISSGPQEPEVEYMTPEEEAAAPMNEYLKKLQDTDNDYLPDALSQQDDDVYDALALAIEAREPEAIGRIVLAMTDDNLEYPK